jgi:putative sigma-54 modulation protein
MQIDITGHHVELTPALRGYVQEKIGRLARHFDHFTNSHVTLSVEKLRHKAEATLNVSGAAIHADAIEPDMYAAIDALTDKLDRQIAKHKEKRQDRHRDEKAARQLN